MKITEEILKENGYSKYYQNFKYETFSYWKTIKDKDEKLYQIGVLFYDLFNKISIQFECLLIENSLNMSYCEDITIEEFEAMAEKFYSTFK
jgi:hypothetical protein